MSILLMQFPKSTKYHYPSYPRVFYPSIPRRDPRDIVYVYYIARILTQSGPFLYLESCH